MANPDRGIYQPPPEDIRLYDPDIEEEEEQERSRLPILIVIALLVLAAFAGVVWLAYNQGVARGRADAPRVIAAPEGPVRTAPEEAANNAVSPYTGLKIYNQPVPPDEEAATSEAPAPSEQAANKPPPEASEAPPAEQAAPPPELTDTGPSQMAPSSEPVATQPPARIAAAPPPAAATKPVTTANVGAGNVLIQIGSFPSEETAIAAWKAFQVKHADTVQGVVPDIKSFDLGEKGTWYRLRIGPFADKATAKATCEKLKAEGAAACIIAMP